MKKVLLFIIVVGLGAWIVDSSGVGFPRTVGMDSDWARETHAKVPVAVYFKYKGDEWLITDQKQVNDAVDALAAREHSERYSLFGKKLPDEPEKTPNEVWIQYQDKPYEKLFAFGDPNDDVGKKTKEYLDSLSGFASHPPAGFSPTSNNSS
jgi:hypothetical protein